MPELSESAEELLESLFVVEHHAPGEPCARQSIADARAEEAVSELAAAGLITRESDSVTLTAAGRQEGEGVLRRHRLAERLLVDIFALGDDLMHETACRFEHAIRRGMEERICTLLGHPRVCPHGHPIPPGACCVEKREVAEPIVATLADLPAGATGRIAYIETEQRAILDKLIAMGALPGAAVTVIRTSPAYVFQVGQTQVAVDREVAQRVHLHVDRPRSAGGRGRKGLRRRLRGG